MTEDFRVMASSFHLLESAHKSRYYTPGGGALAQEVERLAGNRAVERLAGNRKVAGSIPGSS